MEGIVQNQLSCRQVKLLEPVEMQLSTLKKRLVVPSTKIQFVNATTSTKSKMIASFSLENQQEGSTSGQTNYEVIHNISASHTSGPSVAAGPSSLPESGSLIGLSTTATQPSTSGGTHYTACGHHCTNCKWYHH